MSDGELIGPSPQGCGDVAVVFQGEIRRSNGASLGAPDLHAISIGSSLYSIVELDHIKLSAGEGLDTRKEYDTVWLVPRNNRKPSLVDANYTVQVLDETLHRRQVRER